MKDNYKLAGIRINSLVTMIFLLIIITVITLYTYSGYILFVAYSAQYIKILFILCESTVNRATLK